MTPNKEQSAKFLAELNALCFAHGILIKAQKPYRLIFGHGSYRMDDEHPHFFKMEQTHDGA